MMPAKNMSLSQRWADLMRQGASDIEVVAVIGAINDIAASRQGNRAAIIVACAQILAQNITQAAPDIAQEIRAGVLALIDGFAMQSALEDFTAD